MLVDIVIGTVKSVKELVEIIEAFVIIRHQFVKRRFLKSPKYFSPTSSLHDLKRIIRLLAHTSDWISDDTELMKQVKSDLWQLAVRLSNEQYSLLVLSSETSEEEKIQALRQLSMIDTPSAKSALLRFSGEGGFPTRLREAAVAFASDIHSNSKKPLSGTGDQSPDGFCGS